MNRRSFFKCLPGVAAMVLTAPTMALAEPEWDAEPRVMFVPVHTNDLGEHVISVCWSAKYLGVECGGEVLGQFTLERGMPIEWLDEFRRIADTYAAKALKEICIQ